MMSGAVMEACISDVPPAFNVPVGGDSDGISQRCLVLEKPE